MIDAGASVIYQLAAEAMGMWDQQHTPFWLVHSEGGRLAEPQSTCLQSVFCTDSKGLCLLAGHSAWQSCD